MRSPAPSVRLKPLAAGVAAIFALATPVAMAATTWTVDTCTDANAGNLVTHTGSLRFAAANAASGDTIEMSGLSSICSTITLQTGAIAVTQGSLTLNGPGMDALTITRDPSGLQDRIFTHSGSGGTLTLNNLSISSGYLFPYGDANGGCISSRGSVSLDHVRVSSCTAKSNYNVRGGGVYTFVSLTMVHSILDGNSVTNLSNSTSAVEGGGADVLGNFSASYSTISNNHVDAFVSTLGFGGGLQLRNDVTITNSTISGNSASRSAGGIRISSPTSARVDIIDSTISGNSATNNIVGGILSTAGTVHLYNSTIAFNTAFNIVSSFSPGLALNSNAGTILATLQSSVLANNTYGTVDNDLSTAGSNAITVLGANNLVRAHQFSNTTVLGNPIATMACPLLGPLRDNGGPTQTHALLSHSPGIDQGNNSRMSALSNDQRGPPYLRVSGTIADIGAYEVQQGEIIFNNDFEGCP